MWVRGLKLTNSTTHHLSIMSHPMWVRGLKQNHQDFECPHTVAPYVGAWIETYTYR